MNEMRMRAAAVVVLGGVMAAVGCKTAPAPGPAPIVNADGSTTNANGSVTVPANSRAAVQEGAPAGMAVRNRDGSITNPDGSVTYPAGSRVAERENAPNTVQTAPSPAYGTRAPLNEPSRVNTAPVPAVSMTVPAGTAVSVRINNGLAASRNEVGDRFTGTLNAPLMRGDTVVFPSGTPVSGEVVSSKGKGRFEGAGDLGVSLTAIGRDRVETNVYEKNSPGRGKRTTGFVAGGAGLGALIGGLAGGGKGAAIGALAGAGGGTAASAYTGGRDVVIPAESVIRFQLTQSLTR